MLKRGDFSILLFSLVTAYGCVSHHSVSRAKVSIEKDEYIHPLSLDRVIYISSKEFTDRLVTSEKYWQSQQKKGVRNSPQLISYKIALRKYKEAESLARFNLQQDFHDEESLCLLATIQYILGRSKFAEAILEPLLRSKDKLIASQAHNIKGLISWRTRDWDEARRQFDIALANSNNNSGALMNRALLALALREEKTAERLLREISQIEGAAYDDARFHYGVALSLENNSDAALESFESVSNYGSNPMVVLNMAIVNYNKGDNEATSKLLKKYIKVSSSNSVDSRRVLSLSEGLRLRKGKKALSDAEIRKLASSKNSKNDDEDSSFSVMTEIGGVPLD